MRTRGSERRSLGGRWWPATAGLALLCLAAACSSTAGSATRHTPTTAAVHAPRPATYTGDVAGFYRVPRPLPPGQPGELIRVQRVGTSGGRVTERVMYHSRDTRGRDRAVTGLVTYPTGRAPAGGRPVVSWEHGTVGLAPACAPSRAGLPVSAFGLAGVVSVATDYIGLGPVGELHAYLDGAAEAHSGIDAVRAARHLADAHAGSSWVAVGHSQGGHAALFTNQLAASYAPELRLEGTVVVAPAAQLTKLFGPADQIVPRVVGVLALYGLATDYPELHPSDYVAAGLAHNAKALSTGCYDAAISAVASVPFDDWYVRNPLETEPARSIFVANDPGKVRAASPILLIGGTADTYVVPARVEATFRQLCSVHQVTVLDMLAGANHGTEVLQGGATISAWLGDRLAGRPAPDGCPR